MDTVRASTCSEERGTAVPHELIPLSVPELGGNEWIYLKECLDTGWVSSAGPFVDRFERKIAEYLEATYAVAVVNGTAGLHLALRVLGVQPDDEVLVPTLTFIAPVNAVRYCGAYPVFVDADPTTWQMDTEKVRAFLREQCEIREVVPGNRECWNTRTRRRVRAMLPVHILGLACAMDEIMELAREYRLRVIEDAAEAIGVRYKHRHAGTWGHVGVFSFNGNKTMTCGGGGMVVTDGKAYREYAQQWLERDEDKPQQWAANARYLSTQAKDDPKEYHHKDIGYNYRLSNLQAAVGLAQLERLPEFLEKKRMIAQRYREAFAGVSEIAPMPEQEGAAYWLYTILVPSRAQRDALLARLAEERIEARPLWHPIHRLPPYRHCEAVAIEHAVRLYERGISLPSSVGLTESALHRCITLVKQELARHGVVH